MKQLCLRSALQTPVGLMCRCSSWGGPSPPHNGLTHSWGAHKQMKVKLMARANVRICYGASCRRVRLPGPFGSRLALPTLCVVQAIRKTPRWAQTAGDASARLAGASCRRATRREANLLLAHTLNEMCDRAEGWGTLCRHTHTYTTS